MPKPDRPRKPYPDFPLTPHPSGAWVKKIRGKLHYFGRWSRTANGRVERVDDDGWRAALELYQQQRDDLHAGRPVRQPGNGAVTVKELFNRFLTAKRRKVDSGEVSAGFFSECKESAEFAASVLGKDTPVDELTADDFAKLRAEMAERWGPVRLGNAVTRVRSLFRFGTDNGLIPGPVRYGSEFAKPAKAAVRRHRAQSPPKLLEPDQIRELIDAADPVMRACVLLGVNCGFGNTDCAELPVTALDLDAGWVTFPRPKTGVARRCPLWPETAAALRDVVGGRTGLAFVTARGKPLVVERGRSRTDTVGSRFHTLLRQLGLWRAGLGFYTLRHVFRTVADGARDTPAVDLTMGHCDGSQGSAYRERIDDARLVAVADHVRAWMSTG